MTTTRPHPSPARSDRPLAAVWLVTALVVGVLGWLLFALSESAPARPVGALLALAGVLAAALAVALSTGVPGSRRVSRLLSAAFVVLAVGSAVVLLGDGSVVSDVLLVTVPLLVGGVVTAVLARGR